MKKDLLFLVAFLPCVVWAQTDSLLFDQARFVTDPGAFNGYDVSRLHPDHVSFGPGINFQYLYMLADDFTLEADATITELEVYAYQSYSTTTSTMTGLYFMIYDGNPMDGGQVIWGDQATNRMIATEWTECYRCGHSGFNPTNDERPIMSVTAGGLDIPLEAGTYYIAWGVTGTGEYGPYGVPVTIAGEAATGDALHYDGAGWWRELYMDQNGDCPAGAAFLLKGTVESPTHAGPGVLTAKTSLLPNPASTQARIVGDGLRHVTVTNIAGQVLIDRPADGDCHELDLSRLEAGTYFVRVATATGIETKKLSVVR